MTTAPGEDQAADARLPGGWPRGMVGRIAWRWWAGFALLFAFPFPLNYVGWVGESIGAAWDGIWKKVVPPAAHAVGIAGDVTVWSGGGEPTFAYVRYFCFAAAALFFALLFETVRRDRTDLQRWDGRLRVYLRLFLSQILFIYGWSKIFPQQFPALGPERLSETFGEASPQGLLWAFMGFSRPYMILGGVGEVLAGILLCFRRTATLGALVGLTVMTNVVALNLSYDVGVKLGSITYLLMLLWIALPDARRLADVLIFDRATAASRSREGGWRPSRVIDAGVPALALCLCVYWASSARTNAYAWGQWAERPPLYGLYDVESITSGGTNHSLVPIDTSVWERIAIGQQRSTIRVASGRLDFFIATVDTTRRTVTFASRDQPRTTYVLHYQVPDAGRLDLSGTIEGDSVELRLLRRDERSYRLVGHRFHWATNSSENR
jgi:uncharacterized membrane protein YphA (DoxX/SURF4 family)